jgi:pimeloyl-ACP methyl ester carboxylesterase
LTVEARGARFNAVDMNPGAKEAIVMAHGLFTNMAVYYFRIAPMLASRFRVVLYDLRGHGQSERCAGGYTVAEMSMDLAAIADALGVGRAYVVGYSFGGLVALGAALSWPERFGERLALIEPPSLAEDEIRVSVAEAAGAAGAAGAAEAAGAGSRAESSEGAGANARGKAARDGFGGGISGRSGAGRGEPDGSISGRGGAAGSDLDLDSQFRAYTASTGIAVPERAKEKMADQIGFLTNSTSFLSDIAADAGFLADAPLEGASFRTLLLYGRRSPYKATARQLKARLPDARLRTAWGDHNLPVQRGAWVGRRLLKFFS